MLNSISYIAFVIIIFFNFITLYILSIVANKINLIDKPDIRKLHDFDIPLVGGISLYISIVIFLQFVYIDPYLRYFIYLGFLLLIIGIIDDYYEINFSYKFIFQFLVLTVAIDKGLIIQNLGYINFFDFFELGNFNKFFTFLAMLALINAINFIDGIDGLSSMSIIISIFSIIFYSFLFASIIDLNLLILLIILLATFLLFNFGFFKLPKIFLGDSGTTFFGFILGVMLIHYSQISVNPIHPVLIPFCIAIPIFDLLQVSIDRISKHKNPFKSGRNHLHHLLLNIGYSKFNTLILILLTQVVISIFGFLLFYYFNSLIVLVSYLLLFIIYLIIVNILKKIISN